MLFELPGFEHIHAKDVKEVASWLRKSAGKATVIAGGTDLLGLMKDRIQGPALKAPEVLVNIKTIPEFTQIIEEEEGRIKDRLRCYAPPINDIRGDKGQVRYLIAGGLGS